MGLILVATPIGNLGDLAPRAVEVLREADVIACEDTRRTRALLSAAGVPGGRRLVSCHRDNERAVAPRLVDRMRAGDTVALVTDAGMPGIADPGEALVRACVEAGVGVSAVPGPSAVVTAVTLSGLPAGRFAFESFLPHKAGERRRRLAALAAEERTMVFLEGPSRLDAALADMVAAFGADRGCCVCRELTKLHEEVWRGPLGDAVAHFPQVRGEVVVVVAGAPPAEVDDAEVVRAVAAAVARGLSARDAAAEVAGTLGVPKRKAYAVAVQFRRDR